MKKLLVLLVVASLTALASGMDLTIAVGTDTGVTEVTIHPSDTLVLAINASGFAQGDGISFGIIGDALGLVSGGIVVSPPAPDATFIDTDPANQEPFAEMYGGVGIYGGIDTFATSPTYSAPGGLYIDQIAFHCEGLGDSIVQLITTLDFETYTVIDTLIVHQVPVPEPATIALLCLGGLLLRKKK